MMLCSRDRTSETSAKIEQWQKRPNWKGAIQSFVAIIGLALAAVPNLLPHHDVLQQSDSHIRQYEALGLLSLLSVLGQLL
jgi:hypothetical protein